MQSKSKIWQFLETLDDYELANFYFYKYDTFMEYSQKQLDKYFTARGITQDKIKILIEENETKNHRLDNCCPQCYSLKKITTQELWFPQDKCSGLDNLVDYNRELIDVQYCLICGYEFSNRNRRTFSKKDSWIKRLLLG